VSGKISQQQQQLNNANSFVTELAEEKVNSIKQKEKEEHPPISIGEKSTAF